MTLQDIAVSAKVAIVLLPKDEKKNKKKTNRQMVSLSNTPQYSPLNVAILW